ncbi:MAG: hypothetical protein WCA12_03380, partial [Burkholderiales bacterium]
MSARETLHALLGMGVRFVIAGEKLRAAADHPISDEVARLIRENLPDLGALLREPVELGTNGTAVAAAAGQFPNTTGGLPCPADSPRAPGD